MPYMKKGKCVYKKNQDGSQGKKVGCTKGSVEDYLKALYANADGETKKENKSMKVKKSELLALIKEEIMAEAEMFKMISDLDPSNEGQISYNNFKSCVVDRELARVQGSDDSELIDAFVAMGGEGDGGGCVDASKLIHTIKSEFQMTIDIEKLIEEIDEDGSGEIEYDEFK